MAAGTGTIGHMSEFNQTDETVTTYLECFQLFVAANGISDDKKAPTPLTVVGVSYYMLIHGLVSPNLPKDKHSSNSPISSSSTTTLINLIMAV